MTDGLGGLFGFALIVGLFVWYGMDRKRRRAAGREARASAPTAPPMERQVPARVASPPPAAEIGTTPPRHFSVGEFVALPFISTFLLFIVSAHLHDVWGTVWSVVFILIAVAIGGGAVWDLVRGTRVPDTDALPRWVPAAVFLGYGVLPPVGWYLVVFARQPAGLLVPLVPAALLGLVFGAAAVKGRARKS